MLHPNNPTRARTGQRVRIHQNRQADSLHTGSTIDELAAIRDCLQLYHGVAAGLAGVFVMTIIDPKTGTVRPQQFAIGDVEGMAAEAVARGVHSNVYFAPALLREDVGFGARGTFNDLVAVLGLVVDDDGDTGKRAVLPKGFDLSLELTTCQQPCINRHMHFVFNRPLPPIEAKTLAELLYRKCGGDHGTKDVAHVWRLPQTLNHPNAAKLARGRPSQPQSVELTGGSCEPVDPHELRQALEAMPDKAGASTGNGAGSERNGHKNHSRERDEILRSLLDQLRKLVGRDKGSQADRSSHCYHVMQALIVRPRDWACGRRRAVRHQIQLTWRSGCRDRARARGMARERSQARAKRQRETRRRCPRHVDRAAQSAPCAAIPTRSARPRRRLGESNGREQERSS